VEYYGMLFGRVRNAILFFVAKWIELWDIILSEMSQAKKDKYCIFSLICRIENPILMYHSDD
jgi:hypothetical protein